MMIIEATITDIGPITDGQKFKVPYRRIKFKDREGQFYMTDLSPRQRNWKKWSPFLTEGNLLGNLYVLEKPSRGRPGKINGDSTPTLLESAEATHSQMYMFG